MNVLPAPRQARRKFSSVDALKGDHKCRLNLASQELTTFITPFNRVKYLRAPFGLSSIAENFNQRMVEALDNLDDFKQIVDNVVVYDAMRETHAQHQLETTEMK